MADPKICWIWRSWNEESCCLIFLFVLPRICCWWSECKRKMKEKADTYRKICQTLLELHDAADSIFNVITTRVNHHAPSSSTSVISIHYCCLSSSGCGFSVKKELLGFEAPLCSSCMDLHNRFYVSVWIA